MQRAPAMVGARFALHEPLFHEQAQRIGVVGAERFALDIVKCAIERDCLGLPDAGLELHQRDALAGGFLLEIAISARATPLPRARGQTKTRFIPACPCPPSANASPDRLIILMIAGQA